MKHNIADLKHKYDYKDVPLHEWFDTFEQKKNQKIFEDQDSFHQAYQVLFDINELPKVHEDVVCENRKEIEKTFNEIGFPINHNQMATAMVLSSILPSDSRLLCQMGAGKGKSRVIAALALLYLKTTSKDIYIVFLNDSLKKRDKEQCNDLWTFEGHLDKKNAKRIHHVVGVNNIPADKECLVIVDESDEIIMSDPVKFYNKTSGANLQVVCLTATPDDGYADGLERNLLDLMGYKLIRA